MDEEAAWEEFWERVYDHLPWERLIRPEVLRPGWTVNGLHWDMLRDDIPWEEIELLCDDILLTILDEVNEEIAAQEEVSPEPAPEQWYPVSPGYSYSDATPVLRELRTPQYITPGVEEYIPPLDLGSPVEPLSPREVPP